MPSRKRRTQSSSGDTPPWQVILESIESQNRLTIEAVDARFSVLEERLDRMDRESRDRDTDVAAAIRGLRMELKTNIERVEGTVDRLIPLEARVAALEHRLG